MELCRFLLIAVGSIRNSNNRSIRSSPAATPAPPVTVVAAPVEPGTGRAATRAAERAAVIVVEVVVGVVVVAAPTKA